MNHTWIERARNRMRAQGLSQEDLAEQLTCTRGAVGHYLSGRRQPSLKQFEIIARALNTDLIWLLYGDNSGRIVREEAAAYRTQYCRIPVAGRLGAGQKRKPVAFLAVPGAAGNCYALLADNDDYAPRIFAGEAVLLDPEAAPDPGDEVLIRFRDGRLKLHVFINRRKEQITVDGIVGKKLIQKLKAGEIKCMHKVIAVFRAGSILD